LNNKQNKSLSSPINIFVETVGHGIGFKIFDFLNAACVSVKDRSISVTFDKNQREYADISILFVPCSHHRRTIDITGYDLIFLSNNDESLIVSDQFMIDHSGLDQAYIISNSYTTKNHALHKKIILSNYNLLITRQYWTNAIFPQYFQNLKMKSISRDNDFIFINGENRSWRHHCITKIKNQIPDFPVRSTLSNKIHETDDAAWETNEDTMFREMVNTIYPIERNQPTNYYDQSANLTFLSQIDGLPSEVKIPMGYFILDDYFRYRCILFPETTWLNEELTITEKSLKCFFSRTMPWPIGGAKINQLYNELGFQTAWNLLPVNHKKFDDMLNHKDRTSAMVDAVNWLYQNKQILDSEEYKEIINQNYLQFLSNPIDGIGVEKLKDIFSCILDRKKLA
jgi:hypothetical protein